MKILGVKSIGIVIIAELHGIPTGFPNQARVGKLLSRQQIKWHGAWCGEHARLQ
jgi:hypothetical protein